MFEQLPAVSEQNRGDGASEALLVIDPASGCLLYLNAAAAALFTAEDLGSRRTLAADLLPELAALEPREFIATVARPGFERRVAVRLERLRGATFDTTATLLAIIRLVSDSPDVLGAVEPGGHIAERLARLEALWSILVRPGFADRPLVEAILQEAAASLSLERATLARLEGDELVVEFAIPEGAPGSRVPLERSLARAALTRSGTFAVLDTALDPEFRRIASDARCFLASAFKIDDARWVATFSGTRARVRPFEDEDWRYVEVVLAAVARGIERSERNTRIESLAYSDALTALPNRVALLGRLDHAIASARGSGLRVAVLFLDIDGFKIVNDSAGHRGGDLVLAEVSQRLRGTLRNLEYIGRLGGDEFAIVMPDVSGRGEIESLAQRIGGVLTFPFAVDEHRFGLSASIGVAVYPDDAADRDDLLAFADAAMYAAKEDGGSCLRFRGSGTAPDRGAPGSIALPGGARDTGYALCYQPIRDVRTGDVVAAEVRVRRVDPVRGLLAPERGRAVVQDEAGRRALDRWMLREATLQAQTWEDAGTPLRLDVCLAASGFAEIDALAASIPRESLTRRLSVDIAWPAVMAADGGPSLAQIIADCRARGLGFALDGFDGGFTALGLIANLPAGVVKFDGSSVAEAVARPATREIVQETFATIEALGWGAIAAGVENGAQRDALVLLGCDEIHGFYVANPMTAQEFGRWLGEPKRELGAKWVGREA